MTHINRTNLHIAQRKHLFREQIMRFKRCIYRAPTWAEAREMYRGTGFSVR